VTAPNEWRLLIDPPSAGAWNMAVDEVLLEWSAAGGGCCWRFYRWSEPTLSLGYFQPYDDRLQHAPSRNCPAVRRLTGGGAIVHDAELTYSLVVPGGHPLAVRRNLLYETVHASLIEVLADLGISATLYEQPDHRSRRRQPLLCFQRRAPGDVLVGPTKIAGSAQRRRRGAVLQHGSVLLGRSDAAPELAALEDLARERIADGQLADAWLEKLSRRLSVGWRRKPLSRQQRRRAAALAEHRYASARWVVNREG
jgi:lipoate-protein ligase A